MKCPRCSSGLLMIRHKTGFERLKIFLTGMRLYLCMDCQHKFRAPDRRRFPRDKKQSAEEVLVGISHGHTV